MADPTHAAPSPSGFSALSTGTRLGGRYVVDQVIAAGGFGITYLGRHEALASACAIKEHFPRQFAFRDGASGQVTASDQPTFKWALDRFLAEGRALVRCKHPNVVAVTDIFEANGTAYMILGYEEGQSFKSWLESLKRPPSQAELDAILRPLLEALAYVHDQGLLHRDIAPDNILIRSSGDPCLIDFGAARQAVAERSQIMSAIVKTGFSPPEQYTTEGRAQGPWSDIYALAATLYRAVAGRPPPEATARASSEDMTPLSAMVTGKQTYRPGFLAAIDEALRLRTADRPQSVAAWRSMLLESADAPKREPPEPPAEPPADVLTFTGLPDARPPPPPSRRGRTMMKIAAGLAVLGLVGGVAYSVAIEAERTRVAEEERRRQVRIEAARVEEEQRKADARRRAEADTRRKAEDDAARRPAAGTIAGFWTGTFKVPTTCDSFPAGDWNICFEVQQAADGRVTGQTDYDRSGPKKKPCSYWTIEGQRDGARFRLRPNPGGELVLTLQGNQITGHFLRYEKCGQWPLTMSRG